MNRRTLCFAMTAVVAFAGLLCTGSALAQVNGDLGLSAGAMTRFTTGADPAPPEPGFGPVFQVQGHLALVPMLRVGLYASTDVSPVAGYGTREFYELGLHVKFIPPLLSAPWKTYVFAGFGAAYAHQDAFRQLGGPLPTGGTPLETFRTIDGGLLEIPVGLGLAYRLRGRTELFAELGGRFGVAFLGTMYDPSNTATAFEAQSSPQELRAPYPGQDSFALSLSLGVGWSD